jgi:hypothetical protein
MYHISAGLTLKMLISFRIIFWDLFFIQADLVRIIVICRTTRLRIFLFDEPRANFQWIKEHKINHDADNCYT